MWDFILSCALAAKIRLRWFQNFVPRFPPGLPQEHVPKAGQKKWLRYADVERLLPLILQPLPSKLISKSHVEQKLVHTWPTKLAASVERRACGMYPTCLPRGGLASPAGMEKRQNFKAADAGAPKRRHDLRTAFIPWCFQVIAAQQPHKQIRRSCLPQLGSSSRTNFWTFIFWPFPCLRFAIPTCFPNRAMPGCNEPWSH